MLARAGDRGYLDSSWRGSLRLAAQDVALSRRKQGFESPRERQIIQQLRRGRGRLARDFAALYNPCIQLHLRATCEF